jgi:hypothetical protein
MASVELGPLEDQATILRQRRTGAGDPSTFGTPKSHEDTYGPYEAKLHSKVSQDQRQPDRHVVETKYSLSIASDVEPVESDLITVVLRGGRTLEFRVPGTANDRRSWWGNTPVWNVELEQTTEA